MLKRVTLAIVAIVSGIAAAFPAAQSGIPKSTQENPGRARHQGEFVVIGCVSREGQGAAPAFIISDSRATPPAQYRAEGDADLLRMHVGHTVEIAGPITPPPGGGGGMPTLKMQSLTYLSTTCVKLK